MILKKLGDEYKLYSHDSCIATTYESPYKKLSLKNCQAIERGYDVIDLADWYGIETEIKSGRKVNDEDFISGFETALQIRGDKKFSEEDMIKAIKLARIKDTNPKNTSAFLTLENEIIQSLQQTQWDVEIEMEQDYLKWKQSDIEDIKDCLVPKLDAENCLILKRK